MDKSSRDKKLACLGTTKERIIDEWDDGMILYAPGKFDHWRVSVVKGDVSFPPYMRQIDTAEMTVRYKMGNNNFKEFYVKIKSIDGDPRDIDVKNKIYDIAKDYKEYFEDGIEGFCNNWNLTFPRFCVLYYAIIYAGRREKWWMKPDIQKQWDEWSINKSNEDVENEIEEEIETSIGDATEGELEIYIDQFEEFQVDLSELIKLDR